jgi:tRNA dimethylallyltransferase
MDIGTAKPTVGEQAQVRHHLLDLVDPAEDHTLATYLAAARAALDDIAARGRRALLVGGTGLYLQALVDGLEVPGLYPEARAEVEAEPDTTALHARLSALDPVAAARMEPTNRRRVVRALEVTVGSGRAFSSFGPGLEAYPPTAVRLVGLRLPVEALDRRIAERVDHMVEAGLVAEVAALAARDQPLSAPPARRSATRRCSTTSRARGPWRRRSTSSGPGPAASPAARCGGSGAIPASGG